MSIKNLLTSAGIEPATSRFVAQHLNHCASAVPHNNEVHLHDHYCHGKAISITYSECVFVDLIIQYAMHMCLITLSSVACLAVPYFFTLFHK